MKLIKLLLPIFVIFSIGLISNPAFADHPNIMDLTFNKNNFDLGDTISITAQLHPPYQGTDGRDSNVVIRLSNIAVSPSHISIPVIPTNGIIHANFTLQSDNIKAGNFTADGYVRIYSIHSTLPDGTHRYISTNHFSEKYSLTLDTDILTGTIQNTKNVKALDVITKTNTANINSQKSNFDNFEKIFNKMNGLVTALNNTITIQNGIINSQQKTLDILKTINNIDRPDTLPPKNPPAQPNNVVQLNDVKAIGQGNGTILVTWTMNSTEPINQYRFKFAPVGEKMKIFNIYDGTLTSFTFTNLLSEEYKFKVVAFSDNFRKTSKTIFATP